jgi:hypothetical protein
MREVLLYASLQPSTGLDSAKKKRKGKEKKKKRKREEKKQTKVWGKPMKPGTRQVQ